jgi:hypothetical protein
MHTHTLTCIHTQIHTRVVTKVITRLMFTSGRDLPTKPDGVRILVLNREKSAQSLRMRTWEPNQNGSETGEMDTHGSEKCDTFCACRGQHAVPKSSGAYCRVSGTRNKFLCGTLHSNSEVLIWMMDCARKTAFVHIRWQHLSRRCHYPRGPTPVSDKLQQSWIFLQMESMKSHITGRTQEGAKITDSITQSLRQ